MKTLVNNAYSYNTGEQWKLLAHLYTNNGTDVNFNIPINGDQTPFLKIITSINGFSSGGSISSALSWKMNINNDLTSNNYRTISDSVYKADPTGSGTSAITLNDGSNGGVGGMILLGYSLGGDCYAESLMDLKNTGRARKLIANWSRKEGDNSYMNTHRASFWNNTANVVSSINIQTSQYTKGECWIYVSSGYSNTDLNRNMRVVGIEYLTGRIDALTGKFIYEKLIDTGILPNSNSLTVAHSISGISKILRYTGFARTVSGSTLQMNYPSATTSEIIKLDVDFTNINIRTNSDRTSYTTSEVLIEYLK